MRPARFWGRRPPPPERSSSSRPAAAPPRHLRPARSAAQPLSLSGAASEPVRALVLAAREAMTNAAKHSGAEVIDVYAEATPERVAVFVRDRGVGFDPAAVSAERRGIAESIVRRMERAGGEANVTS